MTCNIFTVKTFLIALLILGAHDSSAQRHSGMVINAGVKKHMFSLKDVGGVKMDEFKGNIVPFAGLSYAHVLSSKFSATYEFDFSFAKGTYTENYDPTYEHYPITNPTTESEIMNTQDNIIEMKSISLSVHLMGHYRIVKGLFLSGGFGYDRFGFDTQITDQAGQNYGKLPNEVKDGSFNFSVAAGLGYATEQFRIDLRYNLGLSNMITAERHRYDLDYWRYDKLTVSHASLTFGYFIGNK